MRLKLARAILNYLLIALLLAAWARSYFVFDYLHYGAFSTLMAFSINGDVGAGHYYHDGVSGRDGHWYSHGINAATPSPYAEGLGNALAGLVAFDLTWRSNEHTLQVPYWSLALLAALPLILRRCRRHTLSAFPITPMPGTQPPEPRQ